jgi:hypothetical protein
VVEEKAAGAMGRVEEALGMESWHSEGKPIRVHPHLQTQPFI